MEYRKYTADGWEIRHRRLTGAELLALDARAAAIAARRGPAATHRVDPRRVQDLPAGELHALAELAGMPAAELRARAAACHAGSLLRLVIPAELPTRQDRLLAADELYGRRAGLPAHGDIEVCDV